MKFLRITILSAVLFFSVVPQLVRSEGKKKNDSPIILELGNDKKISLEEFKNFYMRYSGTNSDTSKITKADLEKFLDLFEKYELKLSDAHVRRLDTMQEVKAEVKNYRDELSKTYLLDQEITSPAVKKMYDRRKEEVRARHILFKLPEEDEQEEDSEDSLSQKPKIDTNAIRQKAVDAIHRLESGEKFENLVSELTEDPSGKNNGGDLYYFTTGQMVAPFEDACYSLKVGEYSHTPIRTVFGYHIIQVTDRKPAIGSVRVSHIMARFNSANPTPDDTLQAWKKISALKDSVHAKKADFAAIAKRNSDDTQSAANGGDVGIFSRRRWVQSFDEAAFSLKVGQISDIVRTPYGYHLLKCTEIQPIDPFEKMKDQLKSQYQSSRFPDDKEAYVQRIKIKHAFVEHTDILERVISSLDTSKVLAESAWTASIPNSLISSTLCSLDGKDFSVDSILRIAEASEENAGSPLTPNEFRSVLGKVYEHLILVSEAKDLESRYPEFAKLMDEFLDGIILYRAEQEEMWAKISVSDSLLKTFFETHREQFRYPNRVNISAIYVGTDSLANDAYQRLQRGETFDTVALQSNASILMRLRKGALDWLPADQDTMTKLAWAMKKGTYSKPFLVTGKGVTIISVNDKDSTRLKTYDEAGSEISNAYQDSESKRLEGIWLENVKQRMPVKMNRDIARKEFAPRLKK